jgi:SAM-dependent methyltransferase
VKPYVPHPPVAPDDPGYLQAARDEAAFWADPAMVSIADALALARPDLLAAHLNRRFTGDPGTTWYEAIAAHGPFGRGLLLGCGGIVQERRILETNPGLHLTIVDIDETSLAHRREAFGAAFPGRVETRAADLNFITLERAAYDLIVSADTLHHVVNLEHVAAEVGSAVAPGGQFILYDYTGPCGFRFPTGQRRMFELLYERERRRSALRLPDLAWSDVDGGNNSPFEAVRSADTLSVLASSLIEVERRGAGAMTSLVMFSGLTAGFDYRQLRRRRSPLRRIRGLIRRGRHPIELPWHWMFSSRFRQELALLDTVVCDAGLFPPNNTFARYRPPPR